jgi:hypothetical protein
MPLRRALTTLSGFIVGVWPAGLLVGGLDFHRSRWALLVGFAIGAAAPASARLRWLTGVAAGLAAAFGFYLLAVGTEWRFIAFAFEGALPAVGAAFFGALARAAVRCSIPPDAVLPR